MAINPNIALSVKGLELQNPLDQYSKVSAIQQAQQQNQLAQMQMQQSQRDLAATNALNQFYKQATSPEGEVDINKLRGLVAGGGFGSKLPGIEEGIFKAQGAKATAQRTQGQVLDEALSRSRQFLDTLNPNAPDAMQRYLQWNEGQFADPVIGKALQDRGITIDQVRDQLSNVVNQPGGLQQAIMQSMLGIEKFMEMNKAQVSNIDIGGQVVSQSFRPLTGEVTRVGQLAKTLTPGEAKRISLEDRRVAVLEANEARNADPSFQQRMAAARETGTAIARGDVAAAQALPKILNRAEENLRLVDELIGVRDSKTGRLIEGSKVHPGFERSVGATWLPLERFIPGTPAASFMARHDQIKGASFLEAFESLKGGGAITEKEGTKATDAINRMSIATSENEYIRAAMDLQDVLRKGVANAQARAARSGGGGGAAPAAGGAVDTSNPLLR